MQAQKLLIRLERKTAIVGLQLNATKTKLMIFKFEKNSSLKNSRGLDGKGIRSLDNYQNI